MKIYIIGKSYAQVTHSSTRNFWNCNENPATSVEPSNQQNNVSDCELKSLIKTLVEQMITMHNLFTTVINNSSN